VVKAGFGTLVQAALFDRLYQSERDPDSPADSYHRELATLDLEVERLAVDAPPGGKLVDGQHGARWNATHTHSIAAIKDRTGPPPPTRSARRSIFRRADEAIASELIIPKLQRNGRARCVHDIQERREG